MEWNVNPETMLDYRYVSVRGLRERAALKVQGEIVYAFHTYLRGQGFTEISTPKIVSAGAEGARTCSSWIILASRRTWPRVPSSTSRSWWASSSSL